MIPKNIKRSSSMLLALMLVVLALIGILAFAGQAVVAAPQQPSTITPIGTARTGGPLWTGSLQGNVTVPPGVYRNNAFAIQDATGGMYIYVASVSIPTMALGDVVQVTGTLKNYSGLLEMDPTTAIVRIGPGSVPAPQVISTSATIVSPTQGLLVQVSGTATWSVSQTLGSDWSLNLDDGSGSVQIFIDKDTAIDLRSCTSGVKMIVTGFSGNYNGAQIMPRYQSDVIVIDTTPPSVTGTVPGNNAASVSLYQPLSATFSEPISSTTISNSSFTLIGASGPVAGTVTYDDATRTAAFAPTAPLAPTMRHTATLSTGITDRSGNPLASAYTWSFTTGAADTYPPFVRSKYPDANATNVPLNSAMVITFSEELKPSTVIPANFTLTGPQGSVGWSSLSAAVIDANNYRVTLIPPMLSPNSHYTVLIGDGVTDWGGNQVISSHRSWSFTTQAELAMQVYYGDLHNHTSYSDGSLKPVDALAAGKAAGFDFMAITDHSYAIDDNEWADTLNAVNTATGSTFVALRGAEYTQGAEGHLNVYNTVRHPCRTNTGFAYCDYTPNLEIGATVDGFYHWLAITGTQALDGAGSLAQFNHPGWINFNDWKYHPEVSPTLRLEEVGNGNGASYVFSEAEYIRSLDYGWKIGATNNADTHSTYWGTNTDDRTGVWMAGLTKATLLDALRARRTFATEDKDYALYLKGNSVWMGSDLPSTTSIAFEIYGNDPDGESGATVQLITFGGTVVTQTTVASSSFTWQPTVPVTPGVHYYYVKVTQPDGDRIVSSPIWTTGAQNISLTDLNAEPTIATIYNPSLFTARVTNRTASTQTVTVTFQVNGSIIAGGVITTIAPACIVGPCADGYASVTWQPVVTGPVTITASLSGVPAGDNLDDNSRTLNMLATDQKVPLVLIDDGHNNISSAPSDTRLFVNDLTAHGYNVLFNLDAIAASDLNTETVKLLILNAYGPNQLTPSELQAIGNFVNAGGSLWLNGLADYAGKVGWAGTLSTRMNGLLASIESTTGYTIPVRFNSDEVLDGNDNNGYPWGVTWHNFPGASSTGVGMNVERIQSWSLNSFVDRSGTALTADDLGPNGFIAALGDQDSGSTSGNLNRTYNDDSDGTVAAYLYPAGISVPGAVGYDIPGPAGRIFFYGDANDPYNIFSYTAGDGKQNELFNLEAIMWLLGNPVEKSTIAEARAYHTVNQPDKLNQLVWVEGKITAGFGEFFNTLYVQDDTGGITIHAPAGDISATQYARGAYVRVLGTISTYQGDTEIQFFEAEQVQIITPTGSVPTPMPLTTYAASLESNQGWLTQITGTVKTKGADYVMVDDSSGPVRVFLDGYNGTWDDVNLFDQITATGLVSEDSDGSRIRVRNHGMHVSLPDDVAILAQGHAVYLPLIRK